MASKKTGSVILKCTCTTTTFSCVFDNRTEKNATPWSKERLKTLLKDLEIETDEGKI